MTRRAKHRADAAEVVEMLALIPQTSRKALRVARIRQNGVDLVELRLVGLDPAWEPSTLDHRTTIRGPALRRVLAALEAAERAGGTR